MKQNLLIVALLLVVSIFYSCGRRFGNDGSVVSSADSLAEENQYLNTFIDQVAEGMDSLIIGEDMLLKTSPEGTPMTSKQQITANLKVFEEIVNRQRERISELEKSLEENKSANARNMKKIISAMKAQLAEKDREIAMLKDELSKKDFDITQLNNRVASLDMDVKDLTQKNQNQKEALVAQSDMMNEAYVLIGTKADLKKAGVLSGSGLFSKSKLKSADFDAAKFKKIDIRNYTSVKLNGKNPKILTPAPASSYSLKDNGDGTSTLTISNPTAFWSVSNYLVIQIK